MPAMEDPKVEFRLTEPTTQGMNGTNDVLHRHAAFEVQANRMRGTTWTGDSPGETATVTPSKGNNEPQVTSTDRKSVV